MTEREKVIKGLECCITGASDYPVCEDCPYSRGGDTCESEDVLHEDALALLKAQEQTLVKNMMLGIDGWGGYCPACSNFLVQYRNPNYCGVCGMAVKWE